MRIAITGGGGRIGRALTELALTQGHTVVSLDRVAPEETNPSTTFIQADMADYDVLTQAFDGCDALVHLAAIPSPRGHPDHIVHNNNVVGSYNALRAAIEVGIRRICQASSINAIGSAYSRKPRYDYFPIDERHPTYNEDPYSLSKWICELQADSFARRFEDVSIASMRFHWVVPNRETALKYAGTYSSAHTTQLWAYTDITAAGRACLLSLTADFIGHEVFFIVAPTTISETPSLELRQQHYPDIPIQGDLSNHKSFFSSQKAEELLGWKHDE
jgi:nucleoside-diphosphate-sugar epimerase